MGTNNSKMPRDGANDLWRLCNVFRIEINAFLNIIYLSNTCDIYKATPDRYTDIYIGYSVILYIIYLLHNSTIGKCTQKITAIQRLVYFAILII